MSCILEAKNLKKYYGKEPNITKALDGVSLAVEQGEFVSIIGTSGSGKSTLLNMLGGLDVPDSGDIIIRGKKIARMSDEQLSVFRRRNIGFVFQNYNLVPILNVYQNIVLPIELDGNQVDRGYVEKIIRMLHLKENSITCPTISPADSSREWRSPGRLRASRPSFLPMSRPEIWIPELPWK